MTLRFYNQVLIFHLIPPYVNSSSTSDAINVSLNHTNHINFAILQ